MFLNRHITKVNFTSLVLFSNSNLCHVVPLLSLFLNDTIAVTPRGGNKPDSPKAPETHTRTVKTWRRDAEMGICGEKRFYKTDKNDQN